MNTTAAATRRELKRYIDAMPESNLDIARPMLSFLAVAQATGKPLAIETDLTAGEREAIKAGRRERKQNPESFTPWAAVKKELGRA